MPCNDISAIACNVVLLKPPDAANSSTPVSHGSTRLPPLGEASDEQ
jgi:hypothetical protein